MSDRDQFGDALILPAWRKVAEHLVNALVYVLDVFAGVVRERIAGRTATDQFLLISVEEIDHECTDLVGFNGRSGVANAAEPPPAPTIPETIVEGAQRLLIVRCFDCDDSSARAGWHFCPPLEARTAFTADLIRSTMSGSRVLTLSHE